MSDVDALFSSILATRREPVPFNFVASGMYRGDEVYFQVQRELSIACVPAQPLASGAFSDNSNRVSDQEFFSFAGTHYENYGDHWESFGPDHYEPYDLRKLREVMSWQRQPDNGALGHPLLQLHFYAHPVENSDERVVPPDWICRDDGRPFHARAEIYGGIRAWRNRDLEWSRRGPKPPVKRPIMPDPDRIRRLIRSSDADTIAARAQEIISSKLAIVGANLGLATSEPCIRVYASGKRGNRVQLVVSHDVLEMPSAGRPQVMFFRLDEMVIARKAAADLADALGGTVSERGRLDSVNGDLLNLDTRKTTWAGVAPLFHQLLVKSALYLPADAIRHEAALRNIWESSQAKLPLEPRDITHLNVTDTIHNEFQVAWMAEWEKLQTSLGGRLEVVAGADIWLSRFISANEAIRLAVARHPAPERRVYLAEPIDMVPEVRAILENSQSMLAVGGKEFIDAWMKLRDVALDASDETHAALTGLYQAAMPEMNAHFSKKWRDEIRPLIAETWADVAPPSRPHL